MSMYRIPFVTVGLIAAVALVSALWVPQAAFAESGFKANVAERIAIEIKQQFGTSEQLDAVITRTYGVRLSPKKAEVAQRVMRSVLFNQALPNYIANLLVPVYRSDISHTEMVSAVVEGMVQLQVKGLARLSPERQVAFVAHTVSMTRAIEPSACKALFLGQLDTKASAAIERKYIAGLPLRKFEAISDIYRDAAEAELVGYPDARIINQQQAKLAERVYQAASIKRLRARVRKEVIQRVDEGAHSAEPSEVCAVFSAIIEGMLDMDDPYRAWHLTRFMQTLQ